MTQELVRLVTNPEIPTADTNRKVLQEWIDRWTALAVEATQPLREIYARVPHRRVEFDEALGQSAQRQRELLASLGLEAGRGAEVMR